MFLISCNNEQDIDFCGTYTLTSQEDINSFNKEDKIKTLIIEGENITDISSLHIKNVSELIIRDTSIETLSLPLLSSITSSFIIENNPMLNSISDFDNWKFVNGNITIKNNIKLTDISAILGIKLFVGSLNIVDNTLLGEDIPNAPIEYGLNPVKYLYDNGILRGNITLINNHKLAATSVDKIGQMKNGDILSYIISSSDAAINFSPAKDIVMNLTIKGIDITDDIMKIIASKLTEIRGKLTIDNTSITTTEGFIDVIACKDSICFYNNNKLTNPNGFKAYKEISGSLIIENCPNITFWAADALTNITQIKGSVIITSGLTTQGMLRSLKRVEGDFDIENGGTTNGYQLWDFKGMDLEYIGGNLILKNNAYLYTFDGLLNLKNIEGDIIISRNGSAINGEMDSNIGWNIIKKFKDDGVVKGNITLEDVEGNPIDINNL